METHRQRHDHHGNHTLPCAGCRKRHGRISVGPSRRAIASVAALALATMTMSHGSVPTVAASLPVEVKAVSLRSSFAKLADGDAKPRRLQTDNATEEELDDHDHGDEDEESHLFDQEGDTHEGDDHSDHDDHEGDTHEGDDHSDHEGDDHSDHDDHSEDEDGEESFESFSSTNENVEEKTPWGPVIGATLLVNLASLSGCLILVFAAIQKGLLKRKGENPSDTVVGHGTFFDICIPAFSVGALIATAVFLIFPEALHLIEGVHSDTGEEVVSAEEDHSGHGHRFLQEDSHAGHDDDSSESSNAAKFGCAILGGFLLPFLLSIFFHHTEPDETAVGDVQTGVKLTADSVLDDSTMIRKVVDEPQDKNSCNLCEEGVHVSEQESMPLVEKTVINKQLCASILLGDAFHNFADGVFIGAAFKSCSTGTAISIILVTLFHEIAQELADFVILTRYAGLSITKALALNFISGLSVCLGGIVFLAGNPSDLATGIILAIAGGVYFNIAGCETVPRIDSAVRCRMDRVWALFSIIVGTVPIGLILLNHKHCD